MNDFIFEYLEIKSQEQSEKSISFNFVQQFANFDFDFHLIDKFSIEKLFQKKQNLFEKFVTEDVEIMYMNSDQICFYQKKNNLIVVRSFADEKKVLSKETQINILSLSISEKYK